MSNPKNGSPARQWHVASWPVLAWLETAIKLVAIAIGIVAFVQAFATGVWTIPTGAALAQLIILAFMSLGLVVAILDRVAEREVVGMVFILLNNLGHWGMVVALMTVPDPGSLLPAFAALMLLGDLVKLVFLKVHNFSVRDTPRAVVYGLVTMYVLGYLAILVLELAP